MDASYQPARAPESAVERRVREATDAHARGWCLTPLSGKRPIRPGWQDAPPPDLEDVIAWATVGNVGLRTGAVSGVVIIDVDTGADLEALDLPPMVTVATGAGGWHLYFKAPPVRIRNSVGKLGPHIDVRGNGGQAVYVESIHPATGEVYRWAEGLGPDETELADLPAGILDKLRGPQPASGDCTPYGLAALAHEVDAVRSAPEGTRNDALNRSAFVLGQLVGGGELTLDRVYDELCAATTLDEAEACKTIESGLTAGVDEPRSAPSISETEMDHVGRPAVLVPGTHLDDDHTVHEIGEGDFSREVLSYIPEEAIYLRGEPAVPGELRGEAGRRYFEGFSADAARVFVSDYVRAVKWVGIPNTDRRVLKLCTVSRPLAGLVTAEASRIDGIRHLDSIVPYPVMGCRPGWNENGTYYDETPALEGLRPETNREVIGAMLEDLVVDFPFADEASRQNFIGLLLTPLVRPVLEGNTPLHLVLSSLERTGKTKLVEEVLGGVLLGYPTPSVQLTGNEEEIDKRIVGLLLKARPIIHLDNLRAHLDSGALASLLTSASYQGRMLGTNAMPELRNRMVIVGSGNNVEMSSELAKRTIPIVLQPTDDAPESRSDFVHADLPGFVRENRRLILECLLGMIANWEAEGRPPGQARLGGFEAWARVVGGVMEVQGYDQLLANLKDWQRDADPHGDDLAAFVRAWHDRHGTQLVSAKKLLMLAREEGVFLGEIRGETEEARQFSFARRVLGRHKNTPVGGYVIRSERTRRARFWALVPVPRRST